MAIDKRILAAGGIIAVAGVVTLGQIDNKNMPEILTAEQEIKIAKTGDEIKSLRTSNSETYKINDYKLRTKVYNKPIYYQDSETGKYETPDITVKEISALSKLNPFRSHDKYINAGAYSASWLNSDESDYKFTDSKDGYIKYDTCHKTDGIAVFKQVSEIGVKQSYVILDSKADSALKWLLDASGKIELQKDGSVLINGSDIIIPAPIAWDNKKNPINITVSVIGDTLIYKPDLKGAVFPVTIDPSTTVTAYNDGHIHVSSISYSASRNALTGTASSTFLRVGQSTTGSNSWSNSRSVLSFTLPNMVSATACTLFVNGRTDYSTYDFTVNIYRADSYLPTLDATDFVNFDGYSRKNRFTGEIYGTWESSSYSDAWNPFVFTAVGLDSLETASADTIGLALVSENDAKYYSPITSEFVYFESSATSGSEPYLVIEYTILSVPTGFAISDTTAISASFIWDDINTEETGYKVLDLSGNIVATTAANDTVATISGLSPNTEYSYYVVAYAGTYTTAASDTVTFTTNNSNIVINCNAVSVYSGTVRSVNANYNTGRNGVTGYDAGNIGYVGQWIIGSTYVNYRIFAQYNMTSVPVGAVIDSARFYFYCDTDSSTTDINLKLCMSNKTSGLSTSWFSQFYGWASSGAYSGIKQIADDWNTSSFLVGWQYTDITAAGIDSLTNHIGDVIETVLMSSKDVSATAPTDAEFITLSITNLPFLKVYIHPEVPHSVTVTSIAPDSLLVTWDDWTGDETGFRIIDADTDVAIDSTSSDAVSKEIGGLSANTLYRIKLQVKGGVLNGEYSAVDSCYTRANVPGAVTITFPADSLLKFVFNVNSNPAHTEFAIQDSITGKYVQKITGLDTLGATEMWGTSAFWGGANGDTVKIYPGKNYVIRAKARSGE